MLSYLGRHPADRRAYYRETALAPTSADTPLIDTPLLGLAGQPASVITSHLVITHPVFTHQVITNPILLISDATVANDSPRELYKSSLLLLKWFL